MKARLGIDTALADQSLLGASMGDLSSWSTWLVVLRAAFGLPLDADQLAAFKQVAGDRSPPTRRVRELWAICGRRSGKSRIAAALAVFIATLTDARSKLTPGEQGFVLVLAPSIAQARLIRDYAEGFIRSSPPLASQIDGDMTATEIRLMGGVTIACHAANYRTLRGRTLLAAIFDEAAFWRDETSSIPDVEAYRACMPALSTTDGMLIGIGSPYRKRGLMHAKHRDHYGIDGDRVLVVRGESRLFNPTLDQDLIDAAMTDDLEAARSEWGAEFRRDIASLFDDQVIEQCTDCARPPELPVRNGIKYHAFTDASAGRHDAFTLCIGHVESDLFVADVVRGVSPPFNPGAVAVEYAQLARSYRCTSITGDAYAGEWVASAFRDAGVSYQRCDLVKSQLYIESLPHFNQGRVRLPDSPTLQRELRLLERRVHRSGKDTVDHPRGGSDDLANALCGCLNLAVDASKRRARVYAMSGPGCGTLTEITDPPARARDCIKVVSVDQKGNPLTVEQVRALRRGENPYLRRGTG